jgi:hypothetical protein
MLALRDVSERVAPRLPAILTELVDLLVREIDELGGDEVIAARLRDSIESNVLTLLRLMPYPVDLALVAAPAGAVRLAQQLAQRGVPFNSLWRAYLLCNSRFFDECLTELAGSATSTTDLARCTSELSALLHAYVGHVCGQIGASYDTERERWQRQQDTVRTERVREVLKGHIADVAETEAALGYRLGGRHLGVIAWDPSPALHGNELLRLQHMISTFADRIGCREPSLVLPPDETTLHAWLPLPAAVRVVPAALLDEVRADTAASVRVAIGEPGSSPQGFVRTHARRPSPRRSRCRLARRPRPSRPTPRSPASASSAATSPAPASGSARHSGHWPSTTTGTAGCATPSPPSSTPVAATPPPPSGWAATRTPCSTGCAGPKPNSAMPREIAASTSNSPCRLPLARTDRAAPRPEVAGAAVHAGVSTPSTEHP